MTEDRTDQEKQVDQVVSRAKAAQLEIVEGRAPGSIEIMLPNGRQKRHARLTLQNAGAFSRSNFENWLCLGDYAAFYDRDSQCIEALVLANAGLDRRWGQLRRLTGVTQGSVPVDWPASKIEKLPDGSTTQSTIDYWSLVLSVGIHEVELSPASERLYLVESSLGHWLFPDTSNVSLKIRGYAPATHDEAVGLLEKISSAMAFEIDVRYQCCFSLKRSMPQISRIRYGPFRSIAAVPEYPRMEYSLEAVSLWSHARASEGLPLLQFLTFYQVLEYFFPGHARTELIRRVRSRLKNPRFEVDDDVEIVKIISAATAQGRANLRERDQLEATIKACVDEGELLEFLGQFQDAFSKKDLADVPAITAHLPKGNSGELMVQVAERIYRIRCRIVHSKDDGGPAEAGPLLPVGAEADKLSNDIDLLRFIAEKVIANSGTKAAWR